LLAYLRANSFKTFIVSGGGIEFMRPWTERVYGIPPEQVVGSSIKTRFEKRHGKLILFRLPEVNVVEGGQAGRQQRAHWQPPDRRVRQFRWRSRNSAMDDDERRGVTGQPTNRRADSYTPQRTQMSA